MQRKRVVDGTGDALCSEMLLETITMAVRDAQGVLVVDMSVARHDRGQSNTSAEVAQVLFLQGGVLAPRLIPIMQVTCLDMQQRRLQAIQTRTVADLLVVTIAAA
jgi:hypothetical protein